MSQTSTWLAPVLRNRMVLFILAISLLVPLAFTPVSARFPALGAALLEGSAIVLLSMLLWKADWRSGTSKVLDFVRSGQNLPVLLFLTITGVSCILSPEKQFSMQEFLRLGSGMVLYFAVAYHIRRSDQLSCLVDVVLFLCCAISIAGFVQFNSATGAFASGLFGDHQLYGSSLMALLPVAAAIAVIEKSPTRQLFARVATVLAAAGLLTAHSRSAWIGAAVALTLLVVISTVLMVRKHKAHVQIKLQEALFPVILLAIALAFFLFMSPQTSTIVGRVSTLGSVSNDATWNGRQIAWDGAKSMIRHSPWVGNGLGMFAFLQHSYSGVGTPVGRQFQPSLGDQAHNLYLQTAAELGIPGLLIFLSIPITLLTLGVRRALKMDDGIRRTVLIGAMAATVGCLVDAFASPSWQTGAVSLLFWLMLGMVVASMQPSPKRERSPAVERTQPMSRGLLAFSSLGLAVFLPTAAMAVIPGYQHIISSRIVPKISSVSAGGTQSYAYFGTFASDSGKFPSQEADITLDPRTKFTFTTTKGNIGLLKGSNNSQYESDSSGSYTASITATYTDPTSATSSDTATLTVGAGVVHPTNERDRDIVFGVTGGALVLWAFAHPAATDHIDFNDGDNNNDRDKTTSTTILRDGIGRIEQPLPPDSLFGSGSEDTKSPEATSGK